MRCVFAVATARQPARGPDSVVPLRRTVDSVAAALWRRVLHGGGLLGAGLSVFLFSLSALDCALVATSCAGEGEGCLPHRRGFVRLAFSSRVVLTVLMPTGVVFVEFPALMSESNRTSPIFFIFILFS